MNKKMTVGQKIKKLRTDAGYTQKKLLEMMGTICSKNDPKGDETWISKIETGKKNPNRETILKIIDALGLKPFQISWLLNIEPYKFKNLINTTKKISSSLNFDEILQNSVNEIAYELNLLAAVIFLVDDNKIYSKTFTKTSFTDQLHKILPLPFDKYHASITDHVDNLIVKTVNTHKKFYTTSLREASLHVYSSKLSKAIEMLTGFKSGVAMPLIQEDKSFGAMFYIKNYVDNFEAELPLLEAFTEHIAASIINARKYEDLKNKLNELKNG